MAVEFSKCFGDPFKKDESSSKVNEFEKLYKIVKAPYQNRLARVLEKIFNLATDVCSENKDAIEDYLYLDSGKSVVGRLLIKEEEKIMT